MAQLDPQGRSGPERLAHDMNNQLGLILALLSNPEIQVAAPIEVKAIHQAIERLAELVDDLAALPLDDDERRNP